MNLVFDIDDTITNETEYDRKYAPMYIKKKFKVDVEEVNPNGANISETYGLYDVFKKLDPSLTEEQLVDKCKKTNKSYNADKFLSYICFPLREGAVKTINDIGSKGYKINFISLRGIKTKEKEKFKHVFIRKAIVPLLTHLQLRLNGIKNYKLFLVEKATDKKTIIEDLKAKIVFDDSIDVVDSLDGVDTTVVCAATPHNVLAEFINNVVRIPFTYDSVMDFIKQFENDRRQKKHIVIESIGMKNLKVYKKFLTETFYKVARTTRRGWVIKHYKPLVLGEKNLPKEAGPNAFFGNHRDVKDPLIMIAILKQPVHFAALKRMFENGENMFGKVGKNLGTYATTVLVKAIGAHPVARSNEPNQTVINDQTTKYMSEYLDYNSSIAYYPEGTLNRNPNEKGNLLPLKSLAFKLAKDKEGIIRPFAIVWIPKEYNIPNRVVVAFLKPIYTKELEVNEIMEIWTSSINNALESINKMIAEMIKITNESYIEEEPAKVKRL